MKPRFSVLLAFAFLASCGRSPLKDAAPCAYLPPGAEAVFQIPSYRDAVVEIFSLTRTLFGQEGGDELKTKIFAILSWQWKLPLLDTDGIRKMGISDTGPVILAAYPRRGFYVSAPVSSPKLLGKALQDRFTGLVRANRAGAPYQEWMLGTDTLFRLANNRFFVFYNGPKPGPEGGATPAALFAAPADRYRVWLSREAVRESAIPLLSLAGAPVLMDYRRERDHLLFDARLLFTHSDPFAVLFGKGDLAPLFGTITWAAPGYGLGGAAGTGDILFFQTSFSPEQLWNTVLRPRIKAEAERRIGTVGNLAARLFGGRRSLVDQAIDKAGVEGMLPLFSGRIAFRLHSFASIPESLSMVQLMDAASGSLLIEARSNGAAVSLLSNIGRLLGMTGARLQEREENGFVYHALSLFPFRIPRYLYLATQGRAVVISWKREEVLARSNKDDPAGGGLGRTAGYLAPLLRGRPVKYWLGISLRDFLANLGKQLDWTTQANLSPITRQIGVLPRVGVILSRDGQSPVLSADLTLAEVPGAVDPFARDTDSSDPVLYGLGAFFLSLILLALGRFVYKKIRYRN